MVRAPVMNGGIYGVTASSSGATDEFSQLSQNHRRNDTELATQELKIEDAENRKAGTSERCTDLTTAARYRCRC